MSGWVYLCVCPHGVRVRTDVGLNCVAPPLAEVLYGGHSCSLVGCCGGCTNAEAVSVVLLRIVARVF